MNARTTIRTTKTIWPQIYAYTLPTIRENDGWIKIGYTERFDVDERIREQTKTAAINLPYHKLWTEPAKFSTGDDWFKDTQFHAYLEKAKSVSRRPNSEWFYYDGIPEQAHSDFESFRNREFDQAKETLSYTLRAEQEEAVSVTLAYAMRHANGENSEFLWNAKPRFGKTLATYDFARRFFAQKVLILTNRPAVANSWFDDFERFIAWQSDFAFVSTADSLKDRPVMTREQFTAQLDTPNGKNSMIAFISLQDLKGAISFGGSYNKLAWVKDLGWDLLVIDESHEGVDTFKTDIAIDQIMRRFTLYLSGTPFKAIASDRFRDEQIFNWTYADEQAAKATWDDPDTLNPYERLPMLSLFSYRMSAMITDEVNQGAQIDGEDMDYAFDLNEFFATNESGTFLHESDVVKWLDSLTRNEKYPFSTPALRNELKHTFWLLNRVASAKALQKLLRKHPVFENYEIILAAGDGRTEDDPVVNERAYDRVREAICTHDKTITLSVGQLTTGVTIPEWTAVLMLSNVKSPALYMQAAFRAQNPWMTVINGQTHRKENAYVFDFAPERTLTIYDEFANNLSRKTVSGGGTSEDRQENLRTLLNFFPVIGEDTDGRMVELDVNQVLTIPRTIKAQEVVKRGFMSNLLFQNISGVFASAGAREILEMLNPVDPGKVLPSATSKKIDPLGVQVDDKGEAIVPADIVVATTDARFGKKIYEAVVTTAVSAGDNTAKQLPKKIVDEFTRQTQGVIRELVKENGLTVKTADRIVQQNKQALAREVAIVQKQSEIRQAEVEVEYQRELAAAKNDPAKVAEAKETYRAQQERIENDFTAELERTVQLASASLARQSTESVLHQVETEKKTRVEDDVRARLRGFARTIPSFLMAYGDEETTLATFDQHIADDVFKEVTGISLEQFRTLRDTYQFFDPIVFDESCKEFARKRVELADYFDASQLEDIFDYIPIQRNNQIFTPRKVVRFMVDTIEAENPGIFSDASKTFIDLHMKSGMYLTEIVKRLFGGLAAQIPDPRQRVRHILERQVFGFTPSEIIYRIARNYIFGFDEKAGRLNDSHVVCLDVTPYARGDIADFSAKLAELWGEESMKFDVVVGNPPYQEDSMSLTRDDAIYNYFYDLAEQLAPKYCLISPARFLFNAGTTSREWNAKMLNDKHLKVIHYEQLSSNLFPNTDIKGGVVILYRDRSQDFGKIGTFTAFDELNSILHKVVPLTNETLDTIVSGQGIYRFTETAHRDHPEIVNMQSKGHANDIGTRALELFHNMLFFEEKPEDGHEYTQVLGRYQNERVYRWVREDYINKPYAHDKYRVVLPKANGTGALGEVLSTPLIGEPLIGVTQTFLVVGSFDNESEAQNLLKYILSKFARTMLGVLKITQDNSRGKWRYVPMQDFTSNSDIDWSRSVAEIDRQLYRKYGLSEKEIAFIEEKVRAMD